MKKDQLFKKYPSDDLFSEVLKAFGLNGLYDTRSFSRRDLKVLNTLEIIDNLKPSLRQYYYPCKARAYLTELTVKNVITVLRQLLRTRNYTINSREKYIRGEKFIIYSLTSLKSNKYSPMFDSSQVQIEKTSKSPIVLTFD